MTYSQGESKRQGRETLGGLFFTKRLTLAIYKQRAYMLEYTDQVGYMKMKGFTCK